MNTEYCKLFEEAKNENYAIGAFNVFNMISAEAVVRAAEELKKPVVIQMSMSVLKKIGIRKATSMLKTVIQDANVPIVLHLDHCTEVETALKCIDEGWNSIMFDGSKFSIEDNIKYTNIIQSYAKDKQINIEGEVGIIIGVEDHVISDYEKLASLDETLHYINKTSVDMIAPAIGTAHGLYEGEPILNYKLVRDLADLNISHVVIHGGTGLKEEEYKKLVEMGATKINISTALKHAYLDTINSVINRAAIVYSPLEFDYEIMTGVKQVVKQYIKYFTL